jgi:hypothetical protein
MHVPSAPRCRCAWRALAPSRAATVKQRICHSRADAVSERGVSGEGRQDLGEHRADPSPAYSIEIVELAH